MFINKTIKTSKFLYLYSKERSPIFFILLLSLVLFSSGSTQTTFTSLTFLIGWLSSSIFLFLIRLSDDICDIPIDRITHPERLLCQNTINFKEINSVRVILCLSLCLMQIPNMTSLLLTVVFLIVYFVFFRLKPKLSTLAHTSFLNFSLAFFPMYHDALFYENVTYSSIFLGIFFWLGGLAHDLSHSLIDVKNKRFETLNPINKINQRYLAFVSLVIYFTAFALGLLMHIKGLVGLYFMVTLIATFAIIIWLEIKLLQFPSEKTAKPFYTLGFVFFLAPALANTLGNL